MNKRILIFALGFILFSTSSLKAQEKKQITNASENGIYVALGFDIPQPVNNIFHSFKIERSEKGKSNWNQIAIVDQPKSIDEFKKKLEIANNSDIPIAFKLRDIPAEKIWKKISGSKTVYDSLGSYGGGIVIKLGLGILYFDKTALKGVEYEYRITQSDGNVQKTTASFPVKFPGETHFSSYRFHEKNSEPNFISITWKGNGKKPIGFRVYRQENLKGEFIPIAIGQTVKLHKDSVLLYFKDSTVVALLF